MLFSVGEGKVRLCAPHWSSAGQSVRLSFCLQTSHPLRPLRPALDSTYDSVDQKSGEEALPGKDRSEALTGEEPQVSLLLFWVGGGEGATV